MLGPSDRRAGLVSLRAVQAQARGAGRPAGRGRADHVGGLREVAGRAAAAVPFAAAARLVGELAGLALTSRRRAGAAEDDGNATRGHGRRRGRGGRGGTLALLLPDPSLSDKLYMANKRHGHSDDRSGPSRASKGEDGKARTREVEMAAVFTQTAMNRGIPGPRSRFFLLPGHPRGCAGVGS